jgi:hypothetical protein
MLFDSFEKKVNLSLSGNDVQPIEKLKNHFKQSISDHACAIEHHSNIFKIISHWMIFFKKFLTFGEIL